MDRTNRLWRAAGQEQARGSSRRRRRQCGPEATLTSAPIGAIAVTGVERRTRPDEAGARSSRYAGPRPHCGPRRAPSRGVRALFCRPLRRGRIAPTSEARPIAALDANRRAGRAPAAAHLEPAARRCALTAIGGQKKDPGNEGSRGCACAEFHALRRKREFNFNPAPGSFRNRDGGRRHAPTPRRLTIRFEAWRPRLPGYKAQHSRRRGAIRSRRMDHRRDTPPSRRAEATPPGRQAKARDPSSMRGTQEADQPRPTNAGQIARMAMRSARSDRTPRRASRGPVRPVRPRFSGGSSRSRRSLQTRRSSLAKAPSWILHAGRLRHRQRLTPRRARRLDLAFVLPSYLASNTRFATSRSGR